MFVRECKYYLMTTKQLKDEVERIGRELETETNINTKMKYYNALADIMKTIIRKQRNNKEVMDYIDKSLRELKTQSEVSL